MQHALSCLTHLLNGAAAACLVLLQTWCRGKRVWESESLCLDCHKFSWRGYRDPDFKTPEQYEKERWGALVAGLQG